MSADPAGARDTEFPNLYAAVVAAYRNAPNDVSAEIIDGELFTLPRPGVPHASAAADLVIELGPPFTRDRCDSRDPRTPPPSATSAWSVRLA
jgi:hypothetical protein